MRVRSLPSLQFLLTNRDSLSLHSCFDLGCASKTTATTYFGSELPPLFVSTTGVVLVTLKKSTGTWSSSPGFTASYAGTPCATPGSKIVGAWQHVAVTISEDGLATTFVNGELFQRDQLQWELSPAQSPVLSGRHSTAIGHGAPDWQEEGVFGLGNSTVLIDELRFWTTDRSAANISQSMLAGCLDLTGSSPQLAACYSFDEAFTSDAHDRKEFFADTSQSAIPAFVASHSSPYLPWCENIDDDGVLKMDDEWRNLGGGWYDTAKFWGYCSSNKPRLPGAGFDYDEAAMEEAARSRLKGTAAVLKSYPGCGDLPLQLEHNVAGAFGGAIYYDSCFKLDKACFVLGIGRLSSSRAILLRNNQAQSGGGIYVACSALKECEEVFDNENVIGALPELPKVELTGSTSSLYGDRLATQPAALTWYLGAPEGSQVVPSRTNQIVDAAQLLVFAVRPVDSLGSIAIGLDDIVEVRVCGATGECTKDDLITPLVFATFDKISAVSSLEFQIECPIEEDKIAIEVELIKYEVPALRASVNCGRCRPGESKTEDSNTRTWFCAPCAENQYVVDSNNAAHKCQECPQGAECDRGAFASVKGSTWEVDPVTGIYSIVGCARGSSIKKSPYIEQACLKCDSTQYVVDPNNPEHKCESCPQGGICNGESFTPLEGSEWEVDDTTGVYNVVRCAPGSAIVRAPYLDQRCQACEAGYYCPGGSNPALKCSSNTFSKPNASKPDSCIEAEFVDLTVKLPLTESEFDAEKQEGFKAAIASAAGVDASSVEIVSYAQTSTRRKSRTLLAASIDVETRMASTDGNAMDLVKKLDADTINQNLQQNGLPPGEITKAPSIQKDATSESVWSTSNLILTALGGLAVLVILGLAVWKCTQTPEKTKRSFEERQAEAQRRCEIRRQDFHLLREEHERRKIRSGEREKRQSQRRHASGGADLNFVMPAFGPSAASLQSNENPHFGPINEGPGVVINSDPPYPTLVIDPEQNEMTMETQPVASDVDTESRFEAKALILGKPEDSVLTHFLGLDEKTLSHALQDPMEAIENEWFPRGFRELEKEPQPGARDYGDDEYRAGIAEAQNKLSAGLLTEQDLNEENERLEDEYEERKYQWWIAGANFDYVRYGQVGVPGNPADTIWLPPQVLEKELQGTWPGGFIQPGDYDTGFYDTPAIELELDMHIAQTGLVSDKGEESQARKDFKHRLESSLSRASSVPISEQDLPIVTVSPKATAETNRVVVVVQVRQSLRDHRGIDECWQLARNLCAQSQDSTSRLYQDDVSRFVVRDGIKLVKERARTGMALTDFANHHISRLAGLPLWIVFALRAYTTDSFRLFTGPMRLRIKPHPLMITMYFLDQVTPACLVRLFVCLCRSNVLISCFAVLFICTQGLKMLSAVRGGREGGREGEGE